MKKKNFVIILLNPHCAVQSFQDFWIENVFAVHTITNAHNQRLRIIAKPVAEEIDAARMHGITRHFDLRRDIIPAANLQIVNCHIADMRAVKIGSLSRNLPRFEKTKLRGQRRPPAGRQLALPAAAVTWTGPHTQTLIIDGDRDIALPWIAIHRRFRTGFKGKLQPLDLNLVHLLERETVFQRSLPEPDELGIKPVRRIEDHGIIHLAHDRFCAGNAAGGADAFSDGIAAQLHMHGQHAALHFILGSQIHAHGINSAGAQLHGAARAGLRFRGNESRLLQRLHRQRRGGHGDIQRLRQFAYVHGAVAQRLHDADSHRRSQRMGKAIKLIRLGQR